MFIRSFSNCWNTWFAAYFVPGLHYDRVVVAAAVADREEAALAGLVGWTKDGGAPDANIARPTSEAEIRFMIMSSLGFLETEIWTVIFNIFIYSLKDIKATNCQTGR